jgi:hypothetical protein
MHAAFVLEPAIGILAHDLDRCRFDSGAFALGLFQPFNLKAAPLGPPQIHPQQRLAPVLRLGAAGTGVQRQKRIIAVGLTGQEGFQFLFLRNAAQTLQRGLALGNRGVIAFFGAQLDQRDRIIQIPFKGAAFIQRTLKLRAFLQQFLRRIRIVPQIGIFGAGVQRLKMPEGVVPVKDASSAEPQSCGSARQRIQVQDAWINQK